MKTQFRIHHFQGASLSRRLYSEPRQLSYFLSESTVLYVDFLYFPVHCEILEARTLSLCIHLCCSAECPEGDNEPRRLRGVVRLFLTANDFALLVSNVVFQELVATALTLQVSVATVMRSAAPVIRPCSWGCLPRLQGAQCPVLSGLCSGQRPLDIGTV